MNLFLLSKIMSKLENSYLFDVTPLVSPTLLKICFSSSYSAWFVLIILFLASERETLFFKIKYLFFLLYSAYSVFIIFPSSVLISTLPFSIEIFLLFLLFVIQEL